MSSLPLLRPYERQVSLSAVRRRPRALPRLSPQEAKSASPAPLQRAESKKKEGAEAQHEHLGFMERMRLAVALYCEESAKENNPSIKKVAKTFGLDFKTFKRHVEYAERDVTFFKHYSLEYTFSELDSAFSFPPARYFLIARPAQDSTLQEVSMISTESGALSKQHIIGQCGQCCCPLEGHTFISLTHADVKSSLLAKVCELSSPSRAMWNTDTLSSLSSIYVSLHENNVPPNVLFTKIMRNKKANIHTCPFAFILFDKYLLIHFPNYFHHMLATVQDSMQVGCLLYGYAAMHEKIMSKFVTVIRIKELTSALKSCASADREVN